MANRADLTEVVEGSGRKLVFSVPPGQEVYDVLMEVDSSLNDPALGLIIQPAPRPGQPNRHLLIYGDVIQASVTNTIHQVDLVLPTAATFGDFRRLVERLSTFSDFCEGQSFVFTLGDRTFSQGDDNTPLSDIAAECAGDPVFTITSGIPYIPFAIEIFLSGENPIILNLSERSQRITVDDVVHRYARTDSVVVFHGKCLSPSQRLDVLIVEQSQIEIVSVRKTPQLSKSGSDQVEKFVDALCYCFLSKRRMEEDFSPIPGIINKVITEEERQSPDSQALQRLATFGYWFGAAKQAGILRDQNE